MLEKLKLRLSGDKLKTLTLHEEITPENIVKAAVEDAEIELQTAIKNNSTTYKNDPAYQNALIQMTIATLYDRHEKEEAQIHRNKALEIIEKNYSSTDYSESFTPED